MDFKATGTLVYDPVAGKAQNPWWVIMECPKDIIEYYHHWITTVEGIKLNKPLFGAHISVVRGEEPPIEFKEKWKQQNGKELAFAYKHEVENNGEYWWLRVRCPALNELRKELGLNAEVEFDFHLTIGRVIN